MKSLLYGRFFLFDFYIYMYIIPFRVLRIIARNFSIMKRKSNVPILLGGSRASSCILFDGTLEQLEEVLEFRKKQDALVEQSKPKRQAAFHHKAPGKKPVQKPNKKKW